MNTLILIFKLLPIILDVVRAIENNIPEGGKGKDKLSFIEACVAAVYEVAGDVIKDLPGAKATEIILKLVNASVKLFNVTGVFKPSV